MAQCVHGGTWHWSTTSSIGRSRPWCPKLAFPNLAPKVASKEKHLARVAALGACLDTCVLLQNLL
eukprot:2542554-Amphidinium_carterae.1